MCSSPSEKADLPEDRQPGDKQGHYNDLTRFHFHPTTYILHAAFSQ